MPPGIPVLILAGEHDILAMADESRAIAARIGPAARVVVVPNGPHTNLFAVNPDMVRGEIERYLEGIR